MNIVIFTDLDGSLLNHDDYSYEEARGALDRIKRACLPLVLTTSKTRKEVEGIRLELDIRDPFIVENGAAVFFPKDYNVHFPEAEERPPFSILRLGKTYEEIRAFLVSIRHQAGLKGFGDLSVEEVSRITGLSAEKAGLAKAREFTEPFILEDKGCLPLLERLASGQGLKITRGGRFYHLMGIGQDKGVAVSKVLEVFAGRCGEKPVSIGLGDSVNDYPMLAGVDFPVLIPNPEGASQDPGLPNLIRAPFEGSRGWAWAMGHILDDLMGEEETRTLWDSP